jgi:hypothetical protein
MNDHRALALEINKVAQYASFNAHGIETPRTIAAVGEIAIKEAARSFPPGPLILKPNRGGKGQGVARYDTVDALIDLASSAHFEAPIDGVSLVQEYIDAPLPFITRAEFVGGRFLYAVRVDTGNGFELCPAEACAADGAVRPKFEIIDSIDGDLIARYESFIAANGTEIAGIEFITDLHGRNFTYDVNTNTNYNPEAEARAGIFGMDAVAAFLGSELAIVEEALSRTLPLAG